MKKELRNAVTKLRKLQDATFNKKLFGDNHSLIVTISFYGANYPDHVFSDITVSITKFIDDSHFKRMSFQMNEKCVETHHDDSGYEEGETSHTEIIKRVEKFINYKL